MALQLLSPSQGMLGAWPAAASALQQAAQRRDTQPADSQNCTTQQPQQICSGSRYHLNSSSSSNHGLLILVTLTRRSWMRQPSRLPLLLLPGSGVLAPTSSGSSGGSAGWATSGIWKGEQGEQQQQH